MSLEQLADMMKGRPEVDGHAKERAAERARQPFHDAWLAEVYAPFWQAPLKNLSRAAGVARVGHAVDVSPDLGVSFGAMPLILGEDIYAETVLGVTVKISYVFAGDVNDGQLVRVPAVFDEGARTLRNEDAKVWTGPIDRLIAAAEADIEDAITLLPKLLVEGVAAHDARLAAEKKAREDAAAAQKIAEEEAARAAAEAKVRMETAALEASKKAEIELAALTAEGAVPEVVPEPAAEAPAEPPARRRRDK